MAPEPVRPDASSVVWLADAPLFIDADQIAALYDAIVKPERDQGTITLSTKNLTVHDKSVEGKVGAEVGAASIIKTWFPFLDAKVTGEAAGSLRDQESKEKDETIEFHPISTPQRQLVQLAFHYLVNLPARVRVVQGTTDSTWSDAAFVTATPRALLFLDLPSETVFIPTAAELNQGNVVLFYEELTKAFAKEGELPPQYPEPAPDLPLEALLAKRKEYWGWYRERFRATKAMQIVEGKISDGKGRIRWIDYRVPIAADDTTLHLHICGRERFDTGTFAYNLVKRGHKHGLRIVGTLKSEPDLNVLAIFEK